MRKFAPLPKSILLVEILGMGLLTLAWLSLNQYVQLPAPIASPTAALVMLFAGIVLMIPAAIVVDVADGADRGPAVNALSKA